MAGDVQQKARGAFFTPPGAANYMANWAIRSKHDRVLEPSCGEAVFLREAGSRLRDMAKGERPKPTQLHGIEIHPESALNASRVLREAALGATIEVADFFDAEPQGQYDVVLGNPPYIRYQQFAGRTRSRSQELALAQGVRMSGLASSWAAFVIHAATHLKPGGRMALVLPAELLSVGYASNVRTFLLKRFRSVKLIAFEERIFPGVLEDVVLLLAEGEGGASFFELYQARNVTALADVASATWVEHSPANGAKWTPAFVARDAFDIYEKTIGDRFEQLNDWGTTYLGAVTGNNHYFSLTEEEAAAAGLEADELLPISPPGSRHLRGLEFSKAAWQNEVRLGSKAFLFFPREAPSAAALKYIEQGVTLKVDTAYKCQARSPWWSVPQVAAPDLFLTYMNHDRPRLISNPAKLSILNSVYGTKLHRGRRTLGMDHLPLASLNSITLLGAEVVGRAYGGGLLKLEPREADKLPVPSLSLVKAQQESLRVLRNVVASAMRRGDLSKAVEAVDEVVLAGVPAADLAKLRLARDMLFQRRKARSESA